MRPYTFSDAKALASAILADDSTSATLEGASSAAAALESNAHEDFAAIVALRDTPTGTKSYSVQFYESDLDNSEADVTDDWDAVGDAVTGNFSSTTDDTVVAVVT